MADVASIRSSDTIRSTDTSGMPVCEICKFHSTLETTNGESLLQCKGCFSCNVCGTKITPEGKDYVFTGRDIICTGCTCGFCSKPLRHFGLNVENGRTHPICSCKRVSEKQHPAAREMRAEAIKMKSEAEDQMSKVEASSRRTAEELEAARRKGDADANAIRMKAQKEAEEMTKSTKAKLAKDEELLDKKLKAFEDERAKLLAQMATDRQKALDEQAAWRAARDAEFDEERRRRRSELDEVAAKTERLNREAAEQEALAAKRQQEIEESEAKARAEAAAAEAARLAAMVEAERLQREAAEADQQLQARRRQTQEADAQLRAAAAAAIAFNEEEERKAAEEAARLAAEEEENRRAAEEEERKAAAEAARLAEEERLAASEEVRAAKAAEEAAEKRRLQHIEDLKRLMKNPNMFVRLGKKKRSDGSTMPGFGFAVAGGWDQDGLQPHIESIEANGAATEPTSGKPLELGDYIVTVNGQLYFKATHSKTMTAINAAEKSGQLSLGIYRDPAGAGAVHPKYGKVGVKVSGAKK